MKTTEITATVAMQIATLGGPKVVDIVVNRMCDAEVTRRADALFKAVELADGVRLELRKIKPDVVTFKADGTKNEELYTKAATENRAKLDQRLNKIEAAVVKATDNFEFGDLYNLVKGGNANPGTASEGASASE